MRKLLEVKSLTVYYPGEGNVIEDINLTIGYKEIIGIVGESGSGKTTLVRTIMNLLSPLAEIRSGEIHFEGKNIRHYNKEQWRSLRGNDMAMIFQNPGSYFNPIMRMGKQFVECIQSHKKLSKVEALDLAKETLVKMNLHETDRVMNAYPFQLSGGMKQRVAIAMALALEPKLICADEPTSALDVLTQKQIMDELMVLREHFHTSIIMVTHNMGGAAYMSDKMMVMRNGSVVEHDKTDKVMTQPSTIYTQELLAAIPHMKG